MFIFKEKFDRPVARSSTFDKILQIKSKFRPSQSGDRTDTLINY